MELEDDIHIQVVALLYKGLELAKQKHFSQSILLYSASLDLIPDPVIEFDAAAWLYTAIGDSWFHLNDYERALENYLKASVSEESIDDAYIWFCLGRTSYFLKDTESAIVYLKRSFTLEGPEFFYGEDSVYLDLIDEEKLFYAKPVYENYKSENKWLPPDWNKN